jgi:hypothetical protein
MYKNVKLNKKYIEYFRKMNEENKKFNELNKDFFDSYDRCNFAQQLIIRNKVYLLKFEDNFLGYLWINSNDKKNYVINSFNVQTNEKELEPYQFLINSLMKKSTISYYCQNNGYNFDILEKLGFVKKEGKLQLKLDNISQFEASVNSNTEFVNCKKGIDGALRCKIQNEIFSSTGRIPLNVEDIYFDENQSYYFEQGAVFIKKDDNYIGYGQIIFEHNKPVIVNFGILKKYRGHGYSRELLQHLIIIAKNNNYD